MSITPAIGADVPPAEAPKPSAERWVEDLDSDDYQRREQATDQLSRAGAQAVNGVVAAVTQGSPEARWRALVVLARMSIASDEGSARAAQTALEQLAASSDAVVARSARRALQRWQEIRQQRAVETLRRLGARVEQADVSNLQLLGVMPPQDGGMSPQTTLQLDASWTGGDEGLRYAADLLGLTYVELLDTPLTEAALVHFAKMPALQHVQVHHGKISGAAWRAFRKQRPEVSVFAYGEGLLGVFGDPAPRGLEVKRLYFNSCAEKAGVQVGDVIASINGHELTDIHSLTLCVFDKKRGHPVTLEVFRGDEKIVLKGELGSRADVEN